LNVEGHDVNGAFGAWNNAGGKDAGVIGYRRIFAAGKYNGQCSKGDQYCRFMNMITKHTPQSWQLLIHQAIAIMEDMKKRVSKYGNQE
jgi:hypothetical protein